MPHGQRDWSNIGAEEVVHGLADMAELAARLWSPVTFNREGSVYFLESFEYGIGGWATTLVGTGAEIITSALWSRNSGYSCKLVAGSTASRYALLSRTLPYPIVSKYGFEFSFKIDSNVYRLDFAAWFYDGTTLSIFNVRYDHTNSLLQIQTTGAAWQTIATGIALSDSTTPFHTIKVVINLSSGYYVRVILNDTEYNLSAYIAYQAASATGARMNVRFTDWGVAASNAVVYVDDFIITSGEP